VPEGHGQWNTVQEKVSNAAYAPSVFIYSTQITPNILEKKSNGKLLECKKQNSFFK
jgi:hypothetical protein